MNVPLVVSARLYYPPRSHRLSHYHLIALSLDGKTRRSLTNGTTDETGVAWIDARSVAFVRSYPAASHAPQVCRMDLQTGAIRVLYQSPRRQDQFFSLALSPDRRRAVVLEHTPTKDDLNADDPVVLIDLAGGAAPVRIGRSTSVSWQARQRVRMTTVGKPLVVDVTTRRPVADPVEPEAGATTADGKRWRIEVGVDDETKSMLVSADGSGRAVQLDAATAKALADADRTPDHLRYLHPLPDQPDKLWLSTFDHRAMPTVHARLDPATARASFWFVSLGPTRLSGDGQWLVTYPLEQYADYGKGKRVAVRDLYRSSVAAPGAWTPLLGGLVHIDSFGLR